MGDGPDTPGPPGRLPGESGFGLDIDIEAATDEVNALNEQIAEAEHEHAPAEQISELKRQKAAKDRELRDLWRKREGGRHRGPAAASPPVAATASEIPRTVERPGTGNPDARPADPSEPRTTDDGASAGVTDEQWRQMWRAMGTRALRRDYAGRGTIRAHVGDPPDDSPDVYATMDASFKVMAALQQAVNSGQMSEDLAASLKELISPDGLVALGAFTAAFLAAQAAGGPIAWFADAVSVVTLYLAFGEALLELTLIVHENSAIPREAIDRAA
jgi:hypothetical protein